jgi:hypothetical protein
MKCLFTIGMWLYILSVCAQTPKDVNLEKLIDEIFPVQDEDFNYEELYETYGQFLANPLNLNTASEEQLRALLILSSNQLFDFLQYRSEAGPLLSIYELQVIPSFTESTIRLLEPFVQVDDPQSTGWKGLKNRVLHEKNNYLVTRLERTLETRAGFKDDAGTLQYAGSATKWYNRFRISAPADFSFGFTSENDAGEKLQWNPNQKQYAFDFLSGHAQVMNKGQISNLIVGDYQAQFGQGLTLGGGFGMGKGSETITAMRRSNLGFIPYTSAVEFGFFRGVAASVKLDKRLTIHSFYSGLWRDGRTSTTEDATDNISSLYLSGFHRTDSEIAARKNLKETNVGSVLQLKTGQLDAGLILHHTIFSLPISRTPNLYNQFVFSGSTNTNLGGYANYSWRNFSVFSEASKSLAGGQAVVAGLLASVSNAFDISFLYRNFSRSYYSFYSNAIAENTTPQNETGIYWGWKYRIGKRHAASGYIDVFQFPWLKFRSYQPSRGQEWMFRYNFVPSKNTLLFAQIRQEEKVRNLSGDTPNYATATGIKTNFWLNADYPVTDWLSMKTRAQMTMYELGDNCSKGFALVQDVNVRWRKFSFSGRMALFHTDDYDTRIYLYEQDAWLAFSIPALQGIGTRRYLLFQYKATDKLDFWFRWAVTEYENWETIGSSGEEINGHSRNDLKLQVRIKL